MNNPSGLKFAFDEPPVTAAKGNIKQPVQSRSQATCAAILEATVQVLVQQGGDRLTTTRVAERAGVSVGTLYQYYPNKVALTEAVRAEYFRLMSEAVRDALITAGDVTVPDKLGLALAAVVEVKRSHLPLSLALANVPTDRESTDFAGDVVRHFAAFLLSLLSPNAEAPEGLRARAHLQVAALEGALSYAVKNEPGWLSEPWFVASLQDLVRGGLVEGHSADLLK